MATLVWVLAGLALVAIVLASVGAVPLASVLTWLILVTLLAVLLVVFGMEDMTGIIPQQKHRR